MKSKKTFTKELDREKIKYIKNKIVDKKILRKGESIKFNKIKFL
jgi:hypothetical protein